MAETFNMLESLEEGEGSTHELECGHVFHTGCVVRWFRSVPTQMSTVQRRYWRKPIELHHCEGAEHLMRRMARRKDASAGEEDVSGRRRQRRRKRRLDWRFESLMQRTESTLWKGANSCRRDGPLNHAHRI